MRYLENYKKGKTEDFIEILAGYNERKTKKLQSKESPQQLES